MSHFLHSLLTPLHMVHYECFIIVPQYAAQTWDEYNLKGNNDNLEL